MTFIIASECVWSTNLNGKKACRKVSTDGFGDLIGSFFLRDPYSQPSPVVKINTGEKNVRLSTSIENLIIPPGQNHKDVVGEETYNATGTIEKFLN